MHTSKLNTYKPCNVLQSCTRKYTFPFRTLHLFLHFYISLWDAGMAAVIAASAVPMVCALPYSTQNVNHIRNHRAFGDLNTLFLPRSWKSLPAIKDFLRTILHGTRYYFGAHSNFF